MEKIILTFASQKKKHYEETSSMKNFQYKLITLRLVTSSLVLLY